MALTLRPTTIADLPHIMSWVNDREVMQYFALRQTQITEDEERRYLEQILASKNDRLFSVFDGDAYVGQCSVNQIYWPARNGRVFLVVQKSMQHGGRGAEMLRLLIDRAFSDLDLHKLWLIVRRSNLKAQAMYLRAGFEFEGVLRDEYCVNGQYYDMVRMGIVRSAPVSQ